ncbi:MAG TPA: hypothetical protein VF278_25415 [Pirellulales bacterium]
MAKRGTTTADYDSPWKAALHHYLESFLEFFFPKIHADINWARRYEALDKEFQQIIRGAQVGKQIADMLFKVWLNDGDECWLFIHVEIQGAYESEFSRRMFDYNTSAYKRYNREVVSLAVLCDERANWKSSFARKSTNMRRKTACHTYLAWNAEGWNEGAPRGALRGCAKGSPWRWKQSLGSPAAN